MNFKKMLTVFICLILMISCMTVAASAATDSTASVTVSPSTSEVKVGDEITFTVTLNATNIYGYECRISIDDGLELVGEVKTPAPNANFLVIPSGMTIIGGYNAEATNGEGYTGSAPIATFKCKVNGEGSVTCSVTGSKYWFNEEEGVNVKIPFAGSGDTAYVTIACEHSETKTVTENEKAATCGADGSYDKVVYCTKCNKELSRETITVPATGKHTPGAAVKENEKAATCGADGSYDNVVYCTVCKTELSRETVKVDATGKHTPGTAVKENEKAATCGADGSYDNVVYCTVCKTELSRENVKVDATGKHTPGAAVKENEKAATCEKGGSYEEVVYCTVCKTEISREEKTTNPLPHNYEKVSKPGKDCQTNGEDVYTCKDCGHSYKEPNTLKGDHVFTNKYGKDNKNHWLICDLCGEKGKSEEHSYIRDGGDGKLYCECGASAVKPADDGKDEEPKNGDITPYFVMPVVLVSVCAAAAYVTIKRKNAR